MDDLDLDRLADIPDPFAEGAEKSPRPMTKRPSTPSADRGRLRTLRVVAITLALLAEAAWLVLVEHRSDIGALSPSVLLLGIGVPFVAAAVALAAAARRGPLGLGEPASRLAALVGLSVAVFVVGTLFATPQDYEAGPFWGHALRCMAVTAALASAPLALGVWSFRHAFVTATTWRSAGLGVAAGALAAATMSLACTTDGVLHVLVGHGAMMLVGGAVGAALGRATRA
ncbi:MAG: NrsF family protein [Polyangiaceae bacterium]|jgi:hypothetical protein